MKIKVPTEEEFAKLKKERLRDFLLGTILGAIVFIPSTLKILPYGIDTIEWYTWFTICFGILAFGLLGYKFGSSFWALIKP